MAKAPTGKELATELCKKFPDTPSRTLAKKLYDENKERFKDLDAARSSIRFARGNYGKPIRLATAPRANGKAGWKPACPPSSAEPWLPFVLETPCRVLSLSDIHCPYHEQRAVEAAVKFGKKLKPDVLILNGDIADFYRVSRWQQDPKMRDLKYEMEIVKELLSWLRGQFPKAKIIYKLGNHEERWNHYIWNKCVELWNMEALQLHNVLDFEKFGIQRVDDQPIMVGRLPVLHGHELPRGMASPVNQARGAFLRTLHTLLVAHGHRTSTHCEPDMFGRETTTWSQGALCDLTPKFARISKWNWGFSSIEADSAGDFNLSNYRISADYQVRTS